MNDLQTLSEHDDDNPNDPHVYSFQEATTLDDGTPVELWLCEVCDTEVLLLEDTA